MKMKNSAAALRAEHAKGSALTFIKARKRAAWHQLNMGMDSLGWMIGLVLGFGVTALLFCLAYDRYSRL